VILCVSETVKTRRDGAEGYYWHPRTFCVPDSRTGAALPMRRAAWRLRRAATAEVGRSCPGVEGPRTGHLQSAACRVMWSARTELSRRRRPSHGAPAVGGLRGDVVSSDGAVPASKTLARVTCSRRPAG